MTPAKLKIAREMYDSKHHTMEAIAKTIGVSRASIYRHLNMHGQNGPGISPQGPEPVRPASV